MYVRCLSASFHMQVIMAVALILLEREERRALRRQRVFRDRLHPLDTYDDTDFNSKVQSDPPSFA